MLFQRKMGCHFHFKNDKFVKTDKPILTKTLTHSEPQTHLTSILTKTLTHSEPQTHLKGKEMVKNLDAQKGKKTIILVSFDERGTPFKRSPTHQNQGLVDPVRVDRVPITLRPRCLVVEKRRSIVPRSTTRLDLNHMFTHLSRANETPQHEFHHRDIITHLNASLLQSQREWPYFRARFTPSRSFHPA